jgi:hypothetical protein
MPWIQSYCNIKEHFYIYYKTSAGLVAQLAGLVAQLAGLVAQLAGLVAY